MTRPVRRFAAALGTAALVLTGAACTSAESPDPTTETTEPVPIEPNQEVGETLAPPDPTDGEGGTEG
jgi:hypothetical protein